MNATHLPRFDTRLDCTVERVVQWCRATDHAAGPGVEFRP